jgi:diguanylate cyclase (GGDEF)-like protein
MQGLPENPAYGNTFIYYLVCPGFWENSEIDGYTPVMHLKFSIFLRQQVPVMVMLSLFPGIGYVVLGWLAGYLWPAMVWYGLNIGVSVWGIYLYKKFDQKNMGHKDLLRWDRQIVAFIYLFFALWALIFAVYVQKTTYGLHYIAIFTQIGATTVAASFLYPVPRLFKVIIPLMIGMLVVYFLALHEWYGYILSVFASILGGVLYYAANSTYRLLLTTQRQATHDLLTDLHNRQYFIEKLRWLMIDLRNFGGNSYLLLIDLDHFKTVNDSLGHDVGDGLLQEVALRMQASLPGDCALARLGGDEFIVIGRIHKDEKKCEERAMRLAYNILATLKQTYIIDEHHIYISASIGVRLFSAKDRDSTNLVREADIAMYEVKAGGRDGVFLFNEEISHRVEQHLQIERLLYFALERKEIDLCYQPLLDESRNIIGAECLARWCNGLLGNVSPGQFIPIAEQTGLIVDLGLFILEEAFSN